jgi:hypothetical protein
MAIAGTWYDLIPCADITDTRRVQSGWSLRPEKRISMTDKYYLEGYGGYRATLTWSLGTSQNTELNESIKTAQEYYCEY